jgi:hypothetical protein
MIKCGTYSHGIHDIAKFYMTPLTNDSDVNDTRFHDNNSTVAIQDDACPAWHFRCVSALLCLPVYMRCNGVPDCPRGVDEAGCSSYKCPSLYWCRGSSVCLQPQHLCDDVYQCPQKDDELYCNVTCPEGCTCYGHAFFCLRPLSIFPTFSHFPQMRFLDASGSGLSNSHALWTGRARGACPA